jgi:lipopolysaccharide export system protein LptA
MAKKFTVKKRGNYYEVNSGTCGGKRVDAVMVSEKRDAERIARDRNARIVKALVRK